MPMRSSGSCTGISFSITSSDVSVVLCVISVLRSILVSFVEAFLRCLRTFSAVLLEAFFQHVPGQRGALHPYRELRDALERLQVAQLRGGLVLRVRHHAS